MKLSLCNQQIECPCNSTNTDNWQAFNCFCKRSKQKGIGIKSVKYVNKLEIKKYGNKLKMELSDHNTKG